MKGLFNPESPLMRILTRLADLVILNVLWVTVSLPIVTFGAATTAALDISLKYGEGREVPMFRTFFRSFGQNFRQSTAIWLVMLLVGAVAAGDLYLTYFTDLTASLNMILRPFSGLLVILWLMTFSWVFLLQARYENPVAVTLKNALLLSLKNAPATLLISAGIVAGIVLPFVFPACFPFWAFVGYALFAALHAKLYRKRLG